MRTITESTRSGTANDPRPKVVQRFSFSPPGADWGGRGGQVRHATVNRRARQSRHGVLRPAPAKPET